MWLSILKVMQSSRPKTYTAAVVLTKPQLEQFYAGSVQAVQVRDINGLKIRFPLSALRPYVDHTGVSGVFEIQVSQDNRLSGIRQITKI